MTPRRALFGMQMAASACGGGWLATIVLASLGDWTLAGCTFVVVLAATWVVQRCEARIIATWEPWA